MLYEVITTLITAVFLSLQIYINHLQITYYTFLILLIFGIFQLVQAIQNNSYKKFLIATGAVLLASFLAVGSNFSKLWTTYEYGRITSYNVCYTKLLRVDIPGMTAATTVTTV